MRPAAVIAVLILAAASTAAQARSPHPLPVRPGHLDTKATPLSESECTQLGGKVETSVASPIASVCNSGKVCRTTDQNKQTHLVCIAKAA